MCFSASKTTQWNVPDNGETVADLLRSRLHKLTAAVEIPRSFQPLRDKKRNFESSKPGFRGSPLILGKGFDLS